ncbi:hypothetical protein ACG873_03050 [Mesorhizobium sp. AaZ16]|uniref:hypothetical protein n=1 Tax=Mesorhizobium sp. AaZ16 TaxID=3402289 RepID=UPI00374F85AD
MSVTPLFMQSCGEPAPDSKGANLMIGLFAEGADDRDSDAFQVKLDDAGSATAFAHRQTGRPPFLGSHFLLAAPAPTKVSKRLQRVCCQGQL